MAAATPKHRDARPASMRVGCPCGGVMDNGPEWEGDLAEFRGVPSLFDWFCPDCGRMAYDDEVADDSCARMSLADLADLASILHDRAKRPPSRVWPSGRPRRPGGGS